MPRPNSEFGVAESNKLIYAVGGFFGPSRRALLIFNPKKNEWTSGPDLPVGADHAAVVAVSGQIYVIGGEGAKNLVQIFDPATQAWSRGKNMPSGRAAAAAVEVQGKIHVIGGTPNITSGTALNHHEIYDPVNDTWKNGPPLPTASEHVSAVFLNGKVYVIGGRSNFINLNALQIFNPQTGAWSQGAQLQDARSGHAAVAFEKRIIVFGGEDINSRSVIPTTERYDPSGNSWSFLENSPISVHGSPSSTVGIFIYRFGGSEIGGSGNGIDKVQRFSISNKPKGPKELIVTNITANSVRLQWKDLADNETAFQIQQKSGNGKYQTAASTAANIKNLIISGLARNTEYTFRVRAQNGCGSSAFSNTIKATTLP